MATKYNHVPVHHAPIANVTKESELHALPTRYHNTKSTASSIAALINTNSPKCKPSPRRQYSVSAFTLLKKQYHQLPTGIPLSTPKSKCQKGTRPKDLLWCRIETPPTHHTRNCKNAMYLMYTSKF